MLTISAVAVLYALSAAPEPAEPLAIQGLTWLDALPMEVPESYAKPGRGGCRIDFGGVFVNSRMRLVPAVAGEVRFVARRQMKLSEPVLAREVVRIYVGDDPGCCGGGERVLIREVASEPFWTDGDQLINDVRPFAIPLLPGEYKVSIAIELYEARDSSSKGWQPGAVDTRRFLVH
jgi:hypothetical protein